MEFLIVALLGLAFLTLGTIALVEAGFAMARLWSYWSFRWHWHQSLRRSGRGVRALKRRYGLPGTLPLGSLRFTRSRARDFDGPPDSHGGA